MKAKLLNFIALDLGSSKIAAIAAHIDKKGDIQVLSYNLHHSVGIKSGIITDLQAAESSILNTIYTIEKDCNKNIKKITLSLSGAGTKSYYINHKIKLSGQQITAQDIRKLLHKMLEEFKFKDQEIIHYFPIEFLIDDNNIVENPIGMFGKELSCKLHIIAANSAMLINITNCLAKCQIEVNNIILSIYATGIACLSQDEKNLGAIIIDIGAKTTSIGIFLADKLIYTNHITIGSWHITSDIAKVFSISMDTAEKLKVLYGSALASPFEPDIPVRIEDFEPDNHYNPNMIITVSQLTAVIHPRIEEILTMIKEQSDHAAVDHLIARRIIITGGGSALKSIRELTSTIFEKPVRIAKPSSLAGLNEASNLGMYSTVIGMTMHHATKQQKHSLDINNINENNSWLKNTLLWLKANI